jgi:hypothetical protein
MFYAFLSVQDIKQPVLDGHFHSLILEVCQFEMLTVSVFSSYSGTAWDH